MGSAAHEALFLPEVLENILLALPTEASRDKLSNRRQPKSKLRDEYVCLKTLFNSRNVCREFRDIIDHSALLQQSLFLKPSPVKKYPCACGGNSDAYLEYRHGPPKTCLTQVNPYLQRIIKRIDKGASINLTENFRCRRWFVTKTGKDHSKTNQLLFDRARMRRLHQGDPEWEKIFAGWDVENKDLLGPDTASPEFENEEEHLEDAYERHPDSGLAAFWQKPWMLIPALHFYITIDEKRNWANDYLLENIPDLEAAYDSDDDNTPESKSDDSDSDDSEDADDTEHKHICSESEDGSDGERSPKTKQHARPIPEYWRSMFITQPPLCNLRLYDEFGHREHPIVRMRNENGLTMGDLCSALVCCSNRMPLLAGYIWLSRWKEE